MSSKLKSLFSGRTTTSDHIGHAYENSVESVPPVRGSYPVAGNGPNVLEELQWRMARASTAEPARQRQAAGRPTTAPSNGKLRKRSISAVDRNSNSNSNSAQSGFSANTPPSFANSNRHANRSEPPPPLPAFPQKSAVRRLGIYSPERSIDEQDAFSPPYAHSPVKSPSRHVDLLDAHSNIRASREISQHRTGTSSSRNYGEDVADRNIAPLVSNRDGARDIPRDSQLDIDASELNYLKTVYAQKRDLLEGTDFRAAPALGHVLGHKSVDSDDIEPQAAPALPIRSTSLTPHTISSPSITHDAEHPLRANGVANLRQRESSSTDTSIASYDTRPLQASPTATMPFLASLKQPANSLRSLRKTKEPPPVDPPESTASRVSENTTREPRAQSSTNPGLATVVRTENQDPAQAIAPPSTTTGHNIVIGSNMKDASNVTANRDPSETAVPCTMNHNAGKLVAGAENLPDLRGVVDLTNTVDTDVTTKTLPGTYPIPIISITSPSQHTRRHSNFSRKSVYSLQPVLFLSPLHTSPHEIEQPPSFPPIPAKSALRHSISAANIVY